MAIYIEYEGIKGKGGAEGFEDHLVVSSVNFNVTRGITMETGNCANREATVPAISEVVFTKAADLSASELFKASTTGSEGKTVKVKFVQTGSKVTEYLTYELTNCLVSGYGISAGSDGDPIETVNLSFTKMMVSYNDYDTANKAGSPQRGGYDIEKGKPI
ncbi:MAG: type VI secretion system tube protein Hcp [Pseudomonadota bacterium]